MHQTVTEKPREVGVLLVAPQLPPCGGMALQAQLLKQRLEEDGHSVYFLASNFELPWCDIPGVRTVMRCLLIWRKLWKQMRRVQVVHVFAASGLYFLAVVGPATIVAKVRGRRVVLNYRGGNAERFFRSWRWAVQRVMQMADVVTVPSRFLANLINEYFEVPVYIVNNLLDTELFKHRPGVPIAPRLIVARQLEKIYDIETVIKAFGAIQRRYRDAHLTIVGSGSQEAYLRGLVTDAGLENVQFLGHVEHEDLPAIYAEHYIFLNGSRVDNFPGALLEASAVGLVVISTAPGGIRFMYEHGKDALLVEPGDWHGLAQAVETVIEAPAVARELVAAGRRLARSCDWSNVRQSIYQAYGIRTEANRDQDRKSGIGARDCSRGVGADHG